MGLKFSHSISKDELIYFIKIIFAAYCPRQHHEELNFLLLSANSSHSILHWYMIGSQKSDNSISVMSLENG